jgi:hypothetical protein
MHTVLGYYLKQTSGNRQRALDAMIHDLRRNHPLWPTTFSTCPTDGCSNGARGSGVCAICLVEAIAELTGQSDAAINLEHSMLAQTRAICLLHDSLEEREPLSL